MSDTVPTDHPRATRIVHAALAVAVVLQLCLSLVMAGPRPNRPDGTWLVVHEYAGLVAMAIIVLFWGNATIRRRGTEAGSLFPWFSRHRLALLRADIVEAGRALRRGRLPADGQNQPLPSAVHGLGLLLVTLMAGTGTVWFVLTSAGVPAKAVIELHALFGNVVWAYLIGHAGLAVLHHVSGDGALVGMWSLRRARTEA